MRPGRRGLAFALAASLAFAQVTAVQAQRRTGRGRRREPAAASPAAASPDAVRSASPAPASPGATPSAAPSPAASAAPRVPEAVARRTEVRAAIDAFELDRARQLASRPPPRGQPRDPQLAVLLAEIDILALKPAEAARRLAPLAAGDRRAAWLANLCALATGDRKASATLHTLAAGTRPGEETQAELAWLLEGTLPRIATTSPRNLEEAARTALDARRKVEAALALFACRRMGEDTAQIQSLLDRLARPVAAR